MSPFYLKEREGWRKWRGEPKDIRDKDGNHLDASIYAVEDPEQIQVRVDDKGGSYVVGERGTLIFPGKSAVLNRDGFEIVNAGTRKTIAKVSHRKK